MSVRRTLSVVASILFAAVLLVAAFPESQARADDANRPSPTRTEVNVPSIETQSPETMDAPPAVPAEDDLFTTLARQAPNLDPLVLERALDARDCAVAGGEAKRDEIFTVIDYSLPSTQKRLWVFDMDHRELLYHELVAHGKNTGGNMATKFSNVTGSLQTSLGLFRTAETYYGRNGYSLRLHGLEKGINHLALPRTIVIHGAWYVSRKLAEKQGRIGRSWGCPAVREAVAKPLIDTIKNGSLVFAYYPDQKWLGGSRFLNACAVKSPTRVAATAE